MTEIHVHLVWSTTTREPQIIPAWSARLHASMASVARDLDAEPYEISGMSDHVHLLLRCPTDRSIVTLVRDLKARSFKWAHRSVNGGHTFDWQEGYGAFTISESSVKSARAYIRGQKEHHARMTFDEEWKMFIERMRGLRDDACNAFSRPRTQGSPAEPGSALGYQLVRPMRGEEVVGRSWDVTRVGGWIVGSRGFRVFASSNPGLARKAGQRPGLPVGSPQEGRGDRGRVVM